MIHIEIYPYSGLLMSPKNVFILPKYLLFLLFFGWACSPHQFDLEAEKQKLLVLHQAQQDAHLQENALAFVSQFSEEMISVNRGKITTTSPKSSRPRIQSYFDQVSFKKWVDVMPPRIEFAEDGSMAYMVVDKMVVLTYLNEEKQTQEESTHFAWVSIFKKQKDGGWKIVCNVSTNEPEVKKIIN